MKFRWLRASARLLAPFLATTLIPLAALGWLTGRLLEQDRAGARQRVLERFDNIASRTAATLSRDLAELEIHPAGAAVHNDGIALSLHGDVIEVRSGGPLLYWPVSPRQREAPAQLFRTAEAQEFQQQNYRAAITTLEPEAASPDPVNRAGALLRLARNYRKDHQPGAALTVYQRLAAMGSVAVAGEPAELVAGNAVCELLAELGKTGQLRQTAADLSRNLWTARWTVDRSSFLFYAESLRAWTPDPPAAADLLAWADAAATLWREWKQAGPSSWRGRRALWQRDRSVVALWSGSPDAAELFVASPRWVESRWRALWVQPGARVRLLDPAGHLVFGAAPATTSDHVMRTAADTQLPWTLDVVAEGAGPEIAELVNRRRILMSGFALIMILVICGAYFVTRAVSRELAVARLQSDFVSAVSHEFRSPLTSMRHMTEMLERDVLPDDRRRRYYSVLARETERLHRLVEGLLDFGRMEAGRMHYRREILDPPSLVRDVIAEFQPSNGHRIELHAAAVPHVRGDREALSRALWNLLDNAVKYSPGSPTVWVDIARDGDRVAIGVRDEGVGIPAGEQREIFRKFVRGTSSGASTVKGTGIGLAMVRHIARDHGGDVRLVSALGAGSKFILRLPVEEK